MAVRAPPRRRRDASLGQIPLSSGEIELYSRQDEAARRRRRLLAVRDQERRLAQQVTQRYRQNLQRLQRGKSDRTQKQLSAQQHKMLTELHARYQSSLQSMGAAQRNARLKLLELMETAHDERHKWAFNAQVTGKQRLQEAREVREEEEKKRTERRRQVEQNVERLRVLTGQQRRQASARARHEQQLVEQRAKDREEIERLRREHSPEEVFVTPRPKAKDVQAYRFTRTHCVVPSVEMEKERPAVTVIRHNRRHPTALHGGQEADKYREEEDRRRERDRLVVEQQEETAADRGKAALGNVTSRQQGQQALEWLALVDKMERRARGMEFGGEEDVALDTGDGGGMGDDPDRMAEKTFARMLGLDEDSVELSAFSIETDDDRSVGLGDTDHEHSDGDKVAKADVDYKAHESLYTPRLGGNDEVDRLGVSRQGSGHTSSLDRECVRGERRVVEEDSSPAYPAEVPQDFPRVQSDDEDEGKTNIHHPDIGSNDAHRLGGNDEVDRLGVCRQGSGHTSSLDRECVRGERRVVEEDSLPAYPAEVPQDFPRVQSDDEDEGETNIHHPDIGSNDAHPYDPYRQQIDHYARRSSTSAVSIAQYSLPPSDTQTSFDDSLHPGYGDDSFVNELVPMFPKGTQPRPQRSLEDDSQALEEYDVQLDAPSMSRMLTAEQRSSFGRSRQRVAHQAHQAVATESSRNQATSKGVQVSAVSTRSEQKVLFSLRPSLSSSSDSFDYEMDAENMDTSAEEPRVRHQADTGRDCGARQERGSRKHNLADNSAAVDRSDISSDSGVSGVGFTAQLNLAAGIPRNRNGDGEVPSYSIPPQRSAASQDEQDDQSNMSERSFASSSSLPLDAHFNYLAKMTSAVGKSLPLHLRLPAMMYGKKDMTKPPELERLPHSDRSSMSSSSSSMSESLLEEQHISAPIGRNSDDQVRVNRSQQSLASSYLSKASDESSKGKEMSLAEAFKRRHPGFDRRAESHREKLKRQRDKQQEQEQEQELQEQELQQQREPERKPTPRRYTTEQKPNFSDTSGVEDRSDISSASGVSSLGFAVQLNLAAGISRKRNEDGGRREVPSHSSLQQRRGVSDDEQDDPSNLSERSFASSSSLSMDANINSLAKMTSAVDNSLPLHLRLPAMMHGMKDMTKPPAPIAWSASSVSSASVAESNEELERLPHSDKRSMARSSSSMSESLLEEQHVSPPIERNLDDQVHDNRSQQSLASSYLSKVSDESSDSEIPRHGRGQQAMQFTLEEIKEQVSRLPPPPLGSLDMSQPPAPLQKLNDGQEGKEMSLAESFQRRHPGFGRRAESHREKLKRQRNKQREQEQGQELLQQREPERKPAPKSDTTVQDSRSRGATDPLPPEKQLLLDRLASGSRAKISSREMKERSRRLYRQLPEVVERKRQEEVMRRRRERLNELREQEKERRLQQKQRRQQQQHQHR